MTTTQDDGDWVRFTDDTGPPGPPGPATATEPVAGAGH